MINMDLEDVVVVSGKPGIYKIVKPTRTGLILESLDDDRAKFVASIKNKVSVLKDISIYTTDSESSIPLNEIFMKMYKTYGNDLGIDPKADDDELRDFFTTVLSNYDPERVYPSDIKKVTKWYLQLLKYWPEKFTEQTEQQPAESPETEQSSDSSNQETNDNTGGDETQTQDSAVSKN